MSNVTVFDTHPYDADWWTSGLTILLKEINWNVNYVCVGPTTRPTKANANKSARILGVERRFWEIPIIGNDHFAGDLRKKVPAIMKELKAKMVLIPSFYDCHCVNVTLAREMLALFHWSSGLGHQPLRVLLEKNN